MSKPHNTFTYLVNYLISLKQYRRYMIAENHSGYLISKVDKELDEVRELLRIIYFEMRINPPENVPHKWYKNRNSPRYIVLLYPNSN